MVENHCNLLKKKKSITEEEIKCDVPRLTDEWDRGKFFWHINLRETKEMPSNPMVKSSEMP